MLRSSLIPLLLGVLSSTQISAQLIHPAPTSQAPPADATKMASVEGLVLNQVTKAPIKRVQVRLFRVEKGPISMGSNDAAYSTVTDAEGKFRIEGVEPGEYSLEHHKGSFVSGRGSRYSMIGSTLKLAAGEKLGSLRYYLTPQAIVSGRLFDDEGEPVEHAMVMVLGPVHGRSVVSLGGPQGGPTNDRGEYRISDLLPGQYYIQAEMRLEVIQQSETPHMSFVSTYYPNALDQSQATLIKVAAGQELTGQDITLRKDKVVKVSIKILEPDGSPAGNVSFMISRDKMSFSGVGMTSNKKGSLSLGVLRPGEYILQAMRSEPMGSELQGALLLQVGESDVEDMPLQLPPSLEASGTFVLEGSGNKGTDFAGRAAGATPAEFRAMGGGYGVAKSDGTFRLNRVPPGKVELSAYCQSIRDSYVKSILVGGEDVFGKEIDSSAVSLGGITVILRADTASVNGTLDIPEERKSTLRQPMVVLFPVEDHLRKSGHVPQIQIDQNNHFEGKSLQPGEYLALAFEDSDPSTLYDPEFFAVIQSKGEKLTLAPGESRTLDLKPLPWPTEFADRLQ
jgi:protocatechuate 3,4-dioxygenase beta subunit